MKKIAIYGKGGIGKSTIATALCAHWAARGRRVLFVGCDPKHDASQRLVDLFPLRTVMGAMAAHGERNVTLDQFLMRGRGGIDCIEIGGPEPGVGCAGRGITKAFEILRRLRFSVEDYDAVVYDVLGDVVCGGFAAPLRAGSTDEVYVVVSGEVMSLYAANNIAWAIHRFATGGLVLGGLIGNTRGVPDEERVITRFAKRLNTRLRAMIPRDAAIQAAERRSRTVIEHAPASASATALARLARGIERPRPARLPPIRPMGEVAFDEFVRYKLFGSAS